MILINKMSENQIVLFSLIEPLYFWQLMLSKFLVMWPSLLLFAIYLHTFFKRTFWLLVYEQWLSPKFWIHYALPSFESLDYFKCYKCCLSDVQNDSKK